MRKSIFSAFVGTMLIVTAGITQAADITGYWRSIDDKTGFSKGIVRIDKNANGTYDGTIVKVIPRPNYTPKQYCVDCPAPYTNKPILGLTPLKGLKPDSEAPGQYVGGKILDPLTGKIYGSKARLSEDGRRLIMHGYIGFELLGRSQVWIREPNYKE